MIFREHAEKVLAVLIECGARDAHHELGEILAADARAAQQLVHPRIAHGGCRGTQRLGPLRQPVVALCFPECPFGVGPRDGGLFCHASSSWIFAATLSMRSLDLPGSI